MYAELIPTNKFAEIKDSKFEFSAIKPGNYRIQIKAIGFNVFNKTFHFGADTIINVQLNPAVQFKDEVVIYGTQNLANFTSIQKLSKDQIQKDNIGQDAPYLLQNFTSVNVSSDAGAGVGYTNMSVRGSDGTRINVSVNGVPLNDAESHGSFWVNMPDFMSSAESVTLQRGIGASTNGVAAFGANLNVQTNTLKPDAYAETDNSYGSFNTLKNTIKLGTGLLNNRFSLDMRLSQISSDGYIDRASSNLKSYFVTAGWYGKKSILKFNQFTGKEKTYQAWNGVPQDSLKTNRTFNEFSYQNQTDNYTQQHNQLFYSFANRQWIVNTVIHYTKGSGYYEEYKQDQSLKKYSYDNLIIGSDTITNTDLVRRRWLDNQFYGAIYSVSKNPNFNDFTKVPVKFVIGGGANQYLGNHFGEVIWSKYASNGFINDKYYSDDAVKNDMNQYVKMDVYLPKSWTVFTDLQFRHIDYRFTGFNDLFIPTPQQAQYNFFNPKVGFMKLPAFKQNIDSTQMVSTGLRFYAFYAFSNREPVRTDFVNSTPSSRPKPESMHNVELGIEKIIKQFTLKLNYYMQYYIDQLVLTGQINDVGAYTRTNVDKSYRTGFELEMEFWLAKKLRIFTSTTISQNKIANFTEYLDDYDTGLQIENNYKNTDIGFSPSIIAGAGIDYTPFTNTSFSITTKYVGSQFLDNTQNSARQINAYTYTNLRLSKTFSGVQFKGFTIGVQVNNVLNSLYEANGYTFSYVYDKNLTTQNYYFPQAGINYMGFCSLKF